MKASLKNKKNKFVNAQVQIKNSKYNFIRRTALFVFAIGVLSFNVLAKVDISAENNSDAITMENLLQAHNEYRKENGVSELKLNNLLNISSAKKGDVMIVNQCWSHYCPPGKSPWDFFDDASYDYIYAGENLAEGYYSIDSLMQAWINSKTHRDNIVKSDFTEVGFSILYADYLNNSNNLLVVAHFGSTPNGSVISAQNPQIKITSPEDNFQTSEESLNLSGTVNGLDKVRVFNNSALNGEADISGGIFTYRIQKLNNGINTIWVDGSNNETTINSNKINVNFTSVNAQDQNQFVLVSNTENGLEISPGNKNLVNLIFIAFLAIIFLADIILLSRTAALHSTKSFSHYHLALVMLVGLIILMGGFAGQIQNGISV